MSELKAEMEELFADLCQVPRLVGSRRGFRPPVDVYRVDHPPSIVVVVELAGVEPGDVDLAVGDGILLLSGRRVRDAQARVFQQMEIEYGRFERRVPLAEPVDADAAEATYSRGLLTIVLPVAARTAGPVKVPVTRAST